MRLFFSLLCLVCCVNLGVAGESVTWSEYNPEKISDLKNTFFDENGKYFYSEYNADNNIWKVRNNYACGADTFVQMVDVPSCERYIKSAEYEFAVTGTGTLYRRQLGEEVWFKIDLPSSDFQTDNLLYHGGKLYLFPRYGRVYSSVDNGNNWSEVVRLANVEAYFAGIPVQDTLYAIRSNILHFSTDFGDNWLFYFPPEGVEAYTDYVLNRDRLCLADNNNNLYKVDGGEFNRFATAPQKIYGLHFRDTVNLLMFLADGVYNFSLNDSSYSKLFSFDKVIPTASSNVLKNRVATHDNIIRFALPSNEIVESLDNGNTWKYVRFDIKNENIDNIIANLNEVMIKINSHLYKSNTKDKIWYEVASIENGQFAEMTFDNFGNAYYALHGVGIKKNEPASSVSTIINSGEYLNFIDIISVSDELLYAITEDGLIKINNENEEIVMLNSDINSGKLKISGEKILWLADGKVFELDSEGTVLDTIAIIEGETQINDAEYSGENDLFVTSDNGLYVYNQNNLPMYNKFENGIFAHNCANIAKVNNQMFVSDVQNNIFASDNEINHFGVYNLENSDINVSGIISDNNSKIYVASENKGLWVLGDNEADKIAGDYYWLDKINYLEHSKQPVEYRNIKMNDEIGLISVSNDDINVFDSFTGRSKNKIQLSDYNSENLENYVLRGSTINSAGTYVALSMTDNEIISNKDSVVVIDLNSHKVLKKLGKNNQFAENDKYKTYALMFLERPNEILEVYSYDSLSEETTILSTKANIWNVESGDLISQIELSGENEIVTAIANTPNSQEIAVATHNLVDSTSQVMIYNLNDNTSNSVLSLSKTQIQKILIPNDSKHLIILTENYSENMQDEVISYNLVSDELLRLNNINCGDVIFSADSVAFIVSYSKMNELQEDISSLAYIDFNTMEILDKADFPTNGLLTVDNINKKIIIAGDRLYSIDDMKPKDLLKADFSANPKVAEVGSKIEFFNISNGNPQEYLWNFGDGVTSNEANPTHTYISAGVYNIELFITKNFVESKKVKSEYIRIVDNLKVDFAADKTDGFKPMTVQFEEKFSNNIVSRHWNFGDGEESSEMNPKHVYQNEGKYTVSLIVDNGVKIDTLTKEEYINVDTIPATFYVDFSANVETGTLPLEVAFTPQTTPSATFWSWEFGDGTTSNEANPTHTYSDYGNYTVKLRAGKERYSGTEYKERFIKIDRGTIDNLKIIDEFELNFVNTNREGLSGVQASESTIGFDIVADSVDNHFGELGFYSLEAGKILFLNLQSVGNKPTPRYIVPLTNGNFGLVTTSEVKDYANLKVVKYNSLGEQYSSYIDRRNKNILPVTASSDGSSMLVASIADDSVLIVSKFDAENRFVFDKEFNFGKKYLSQFVKILQKDNNYLVLVKENDNEQLKVITLAENGDSLETAKIFDNEYYHVSDAYIDNEKNLVVAGAYKFAEELDAVYNFVCKYDALFSKLWFTQVSGNLSLNSISEVKDCYEHKNYISNGVFDGNAGFVALDEFGSMQRIVKLPNRAGQFNDVLALDNNELIMTGMLYNKKNKKDFYMLHVSNENAFSSVQDSENSADLRILPNPSNGLLKIELNTTFDKIEVFDLNGKVKFSMLNEGSCMIDLSDLPNGNYTIVATGKNRSKSGKLIILK